MERTIGRLNECDIVILDPENRVSRKHAMIKTDQGKVFIKDVGSLNGTYVNGQKISLNQYVLLNNQDTVTLSTSYVFDFKLHTSLPAHDSTMILDQKKSGQNESTVIFEPNRVTVKNATKTISFDPEKTAISDLSDLDNTPFKTLGRNKSTDFVVDDGNVSREHCRIRLLTPQIIEIEDLGSANGTFADGNKLIPNRKYKFNSSVSLTLAKSHSVDLKKIFPTIQIVPKSQSNIAQHSQNNNSNHNRPITKEEEAEFQELQEVWEEFSNRMKKANQLNSGFGIGSQALGLAAMSFIPGGFILSAGIGMLGRYIGQQKSNEIRDDLSYENMFLEVYCCPRCKESFQKKPWITIRDCFKCKLIFR
jgi:pSer/pThr/pTyr-binding forkhead associated (FHA) protein